MSGQQISLAKSRSTRSLESITQIVWHIYSIVDGNLYAIYEEMLTLVELHRIQKKCSEEQQNERLASMNFFA